ncbi:MAG: GntR family transcriptional regulator [Firmicutes bacterium]|nr:GntR family transcriptional regulator [Bacillota bacterium]
MEGRSGKNNLRNRIFQQLESDIVSGKYPSGYNLSEKTLTEKFGVSRTPLREALAQLELEGLVEFVPHKGVFVLGISRQDIEDIYLIKLTIESLAAKLASERIEKEELTELEETLNLTEFYMGKGDLEKLVELDSRFHDLICKASKNRPLRAMLTTFHNYAKMARYKSITTPGRAAKMLSEHRNLLEAIAKGDGELAYALSVEHTTNAKGSIVEALQE